MARSNGRGQIALSPTVKEVKPLELSYLSDLASSYPTRSPLDCCAVPRARAKFVTRDECRAQQHLVGEGDESRYTIKQRGSTVSLSSREGGESDDGGSERASNHGTTVTTERITLDYVK